MPSALRPEELLGSQDPSEPTIKEWYSADPWEAASEFAHHLLVLLALLGVCLREGICPSFKRNGHIHQHHFLLSRVDEARGLLMSRIAP